MKYKIITKTTINHFAGLCDILFYYCKNVLFCLITVKMFIFSSNHLLFSILLIFNDLIFVFYSLFIAILDHYSVFSTCITSCIWGLLIIFHFLKSISDSWWNLYLLIYVSIEAPLNSNLKDQSNFFLLTLTILSLIIY